MEVDLPNHWYNSINLDVLFYYGHHTYAYIYNLYFNLSQYIQGKHTLSNFGQSYAYVIYIM